MIKDTVKAKLEGVARDWFVKNPKRVYFTVSKEALRQAGKALYEELGMRLSIVTGIDNKDTFELLYHFGYDKTGELFTMRVFIEDKKNPVVDSLTGMFKASDWAEREIHEMFGVQFKGHPNLSHLLLDHDWPEGNYPLRKDNPLTKQAYPEGDSE